jgi:hypothetical protein
MRNYLTFFTVVPARSPAIRLTWTGEANDLLLPINVVIRIPARLVMPFQLFEQRLSFHQDHCVEPFGETS